MCKYDDKEGQIHQSFSMFFSFALFYLFGDTVVYHFIICPTICVFFVLLKVMHKKIQSIFHYLT